MTPPKLKQNHKFTVADIVKKCPRITKIFLACLPDVSWTEIDFLTSTEDSENHSQFRRRLPDKSGLFLEPTYIFDNLRIKEFSIF